MAKGWVANRDLYLDKDQEKVVEAGDSAAAFLLAREGKLIPEASMEAYNVKKTKSKKPKAVAKEGDKAVAKEGDKAVAKEEDKSG